MKTKLHAAMGTLVLLWALVGVVAGLLCLIIGDMPTVTAIALVMRRGVILMVAALVGVAISGGVLAGKRQDPPLLAKKRRMPMIIGVAVLVLLPADFYLSAKAQAGNFDALFDGVQGAALIANAALACLLSLNLRDGLRLSGRIAPPAAAGAAATGQQGGMIQKRDNGPLLALNIARLVGSDGGECPQKPVQALCRCGASRNKPFCDGSHAAINFVDTPSADRTPDGVLVYAGKELTIHYNRLVCSHAGECERG